MVAAASPGVPDPRALVIAKHTTCHLARCNWFRCNMSQLQQWLLPQLTGKVTIHMTLALLHPREQNNTHIRHGFPGPAGLLDPSFGSCSCQFHSFMRSCVSDSDRTTCPLKLADYTGRRCRDSSAHASFVTQAQLVMSSTCSWNVPPQMAHAPFFLRYSHSSPSHQCNSSCGKETE